MNRWSAMAAENILSGVKSRTLLLLRNIESSAEYSGDGRDLPLEEISRRFFRLNPDIACTAFIGSDGSSSGILINSLFGPARQFTGDLVSSWLAEEAPSLADAAGGETVLLNGYPRMGIPFLVMLFPLPRHADFSFHGAAAVFFSAENLSALLGGNLAAGNETFMVNGAGDALIRGGLVRSGENLSGLSIVKRAMERDTNNLQILYTDDEGTAFFGAFQRLSSADALVLTGIESRTVFRGINRATRGVLVISASVLLLSILFMLLYSRTISRPIKALAGAAQKIEDGNYRITLKAESRDEIGALTDSFISMGQGLANFERFTNKSIVALARREILKRKGEKKTVTVCFAMIRNFREIAAGMNPRAEVDFLNRFLARVVPCITRTGGLVDKYLTQSGLVVMALWGAVENNEPAQDARSCIRSALKMRNALQILNRNRTAQSPLIKMGCGINTGEVIAGQMGSDERMEYTVIGDAVNLASRIEEPNEEFDTDILITANTRNLAGRFFITEEMPPFTVKGIAETQQVFAVVNRRNHYGPANMEEVRQMWRT
jgi:adenylate cyclase